MVGPPIRDGFRQLGYFDESQIEEVVVRCREHFAQNGMQGFRLFDDIVELLESLKAKGIKMAVATSARTTSANECLGNFGINEYFDMIVGANEDGTRSEKPEIIGHILDTLDSERKFNTIMIGDREFDILGAKAHGIVSVGVLWGNGSEAELTQAGADHIVDSLEELKLIIAPKAH